MSDVNETSYYEIALTNRQVVVAFVILLTLVLAVFLTGVWVGRDGQPRVVHAEPAQPGEAATAAELDNMEEFKFFEEQQAQKAELDKPDLGRLASQPNRDTTLAQDVGSSRSRPAETPAQQQAPPARQASPPPSQQTPPPQRQASPPPPRQAPPPPQAAPPRRTPPPPAQTPAPAQAPPAASAQPAAGTFVVQVFSTHDQEQASRVQQDLQQLSYRAFLSTIDMGGQTMYRVRIGPYRDRTKAEKVKIDVRNKLKLDPWVTAASN